MNVEINSDQTDQNEDLNQDTCVSNQCDCCTGNETRIVGACFAAVIAMTCIAINMFTR